MLRCFKWTKSNRKCLDEEERNEPTVMELTPTSMDDSESNQMKLTDVIDDCLEQIFHVFERGRSVRHR